MSSCNPKVPMPLKVVQPPPGFSHLNSGLRNEAFLNGNVELFDQVYSLIIFAVKSITGVQWVNGQPAMWQQVGAWPQGTISPTGLMPQPVGQVWPPPTAVAEVSGVDANQGLVMKEIEDLRRKFEEEKKHTKDMFIKNSKEAVVLKDKVKTMEVMKRGLEEKLVKEQEKNKYLEKRVKELKDVAEELQKEKKLRKLAEEKVAFLEKAARAGKENEGNMSREEQERELRKAKASAKREETLRKIEGKKNSKGGNEEWDEDYIDNSGRGVGVISVKRRKSNGGQASTANADQVGNQENGNPGKRERWVLNVSNVNKKVKVGQDEVKFGSSNEKGECSKEVASESSSEKEANANKKLGETTVASSNVKKLVTGSSAGASKVLVKIFIVLRLAVQENLT